MCNSATASAISRERWGRRAMNAAETRGGRCESRCLRGPRQVPETELELGKRISRVSAQTDGTKQQVQDVSCSCPLRRTSRRFMPAICLGSPAPRPPRNPETLSASGLDTPDQCPGLCRASTGAKHTYLIHTQEQMLAALLFPSSMLSPKRVPSANARRMHVRRAPVIPDPAQSPTRIFRARAQRSLEGTRRSFRSRFSDP